MDTVQKNGSRYISPNKLLFSKGRPGKIVFILGMIFSLTPLISAPLAFLLGLIFAQLIKHPFWNLNRKISNVLLKVSVISLGFGMNFFSAIKAGKEGFVFAGISIFAVLSLGLLLGKMFNIDRKTSFLISSGTAICGGSAIAALSPIMTAGEKQISVSLGTVFILNSIALFLFPAIGGAFHLSQTQFGVWCAIAIHDTSSVIAAAGKFGEPALLVATSVKLARALWIVPVAVATSFLFKTDLKKVKVPFFIGFFVLAILANTYIPFIQTFAPFFVAFSNAGLALTLFLIGTSLSIQELKMIGLKPFLQGILLWIFITVTALWAVIALIK